MATAAIIIQQGDSNTEPGSRDDLAVGSVVTLSNANDTNVIYWNYELTSKPTGSTAALSTPNAPTASFTPDLVGTYIIQLTVNNQFIDSVGAAIKTPNFGYRIPAANERTEFNTVAVPPSTSTDGWATALEDALLKLDDGYGGGGGGGGVTSLHSGGGITASTTTGSVTLGSSAGGDGYGALSALTVVGLQGHSVASSSPTAGNVLFYSSSTWTPYALTEDDILPGFSVALAFNAVTVPLEVGQNLVNPAFTVSYNRSAAVSSVNDGVSTNSLTLPATSFAYNAGGLPARTYVRTNPGDGYTWTVTANEGGPNKTSSVTETWLSRAYFGISTIPGAYDAAFITGLTSSALASGIARSIAYSGMTGSEKLYYVFLHSFGTPASIKDASTGFGIPFTKVASSVSVTNAYGVTLALDVWESDNYLTSSVTVVWS